MLFLKKILGALSRPEKTAVFVALTIALVCLAGIVTFFVYRMTVVTPARGGKYTEGVCSQPGYVNPILASTEADKLLVRLLFSNIPDIAEKIEVDKNGRVWQITLKENLSWSDNQKLTSDDVVFTVEKIQDPQAQSPLFHSWQGVAVNRLSERKVQFNLVSPYPFFEENLRGLYILPKHIFADTPPANWKLSEYNLKPVGSGPYLFSSYAKQPNGFITYYRLVAQDGKVESPLIGKFNLRFFSRPEDMTKEFNAGKIDGMTVMDGEVYSEITRPHQLFSYFLPSYYAVFFNQSQSVALQDIAVRKALVQAVDPEMLAEKIFSGRATPVDSPISEALASVGSEQKQKASMEQINSDLEQAGWKMGSDNVRVKKSQNGDTPFSLKLTVPDVPFLVKTANELKEGWAGIGAKIDIEKLSPEETISAAIKNRDYQAILYANVLNPPSDLYSFWHSRERFYPGLNLSLYNNKAADQLIDSIRRDFDGKAREEMLRKLGDTITSDYPAAFLYSPHYLFVAGKNLGGATPRMLVDTGDRLTEVSAWYVKTARTLK